MASLGADLAVYSVSIAEINLFLVALASIERLMSRDGHEVLDMVEQLRDRSRISWWWRPEDGASLPAHSRSIDPCSSIEAPFIEAAPMVIPDAGTQVEHDSSAHDLDSLDKI